MSRPLIALLTDFGTRDHYVGVMKGVMKRICPDADFIDITHHVPAQDVRAGAFMLMNVVDYFPDDTIFLVVVDPGVGTQRRKMIAQINGHIWIAPDNGVLSYLPGFDNANSFAIENPGFRLQTISTTFHGRDVFSPAAAYAANGEPLSKFGQPIVSPVILPRPHLDIETDYIMGEVIYIDHFGNIITNIGGLRWIDDSLLQLTPRFADASATIHTDMCQIRLAEHHKIAGIFRTYNDVDAGGIVPLVGSSGFLEISINHDNAAKKLGIKRGDPVRIRGEITLIEGA